jgi:uncharacterized protein Yka (UPF0111/DUF47 family)
MGGYTYENNTSKDERFYILKKRIDLLLQFINQMAFIIDKNNPEAVKKMDEICREADEIKREYYLLVEDINKPNID